MYWMMAALSMLFPAWKTLEIEPLTTPVKASLRGLHSVSDQELWASGTQNTVLHSTDGGRNWRVKKVAEDMDLDFRDIEAVSKDTVFVQSVGSGSTSRIYRSTDAGVTWRLVFTNPHKQGFFDGIAFWNPKHGVAYSDPVNGSFFLIETRNGGDTWNRLNSLPPAHDKEASFAASGTAITVRPGGGLWFGSGGSAARIFRSPDYGKTWTVADTPLRQGEPPEGCFSLVFWDDLNGCAVGGRYNE
ncbi:MAG: YCF48-related protein, partial [Acidobacteriota bacterium]|nr:YCF48-related protein [Acidobacteriota bacterium]